MELRVNDWFDNDEDGVPFDNRLIEMGWMFREQQEQPGSKVYDGVKVKLLYNHDYLNDPRNSAFEKAYTDYFELSDMFTSKLDATIKNDGEPKEEPGEMTIDEH